MNRVNLVYRVFVVLPPFNSAKSLYILDVGGILSNQAYLHIK